MGFYDLCMTGKQTPTYRERNELLLKKSILVSISIKPPDPESASDALELAKGKRPLDISQDSVWQDVDREIKRKRFFRILTGPVIGSREDELGDLINEFRMEERLEKGMQARKLA